MGHHKGAENLIPMSKRTPEERRAIAQKGGLMAQAKNRRLRTLRKELEVLLSIGDTQEQICNAIVAAALNGNTSAFNSIRDTIGEAPKMQASVDVSRTFFNSTSEMTEEQLEIAKRYFATEGALGDMVRNTLGIEAQKEILSEMLDDSTLGGDTNTQTQGGIHNESNTCAD